MSTTAAEPAWSGITVSARMLTNLPRSTPSPAHPHYHRGNMGSTTTRSTVSATRLAVAVALQVGLAALDAAIGSALVITGTVLLVPLVLAVVGDRAKWPSPGVVAIAIGIAQRLLERRRHHRPAGLPDPLLHHARRARCDRRASARARHRARDDQPGAGPRARMPRSRGWTGSSARWARRSPSTTSAARPSTRTTRPPSCSAARASRRCSPPSRVSSRGGSASPTRTAQPSGSTTCRGGA